MPFSTDRCSLIGCALRPADDRRRSHHGRENLAMASRCRDRPAILEVPDANHAIPSLTKS
jgi:hypothetical protein